MATYSKMCLKFEIKEFPLECLLLKKVYKRTRNLLKKKSIFCSPRGRLNEYPLTLNIDFELKKIY